MSVADQTALAFFKAFAQLESELKQHARFLIGARGRHTPAFIDWGSVQQAADLVCDPPLRDRLSGATQLRMLGDPARNRPRRQEIIGTETAKRAIFQYRQLPPTDAAALVEAAYRVREPSGRATQIGGSRPPGTLLRPQPTCASVMPRLALG